MALLIFIFVIRMKEKVKQQEMELNESNPRVFMEAQSATKQEVLRALPLWIYNGNRTEWSPIWSVQ